MLLANLRRLLGEDLEAGSGWLWRRGSAYFDVPKGIESRCGFKPVLRLVVEGRRTAGFTPYCASLQKPYEVLSLARGTEFDMS
jgi:hypothetical protein